MHGISPMRGTHYAIHCPLLSTLDKLSFLSSSSCLVFSELTQASECLRLTAARASDPSLSPSLFRFLEFSIPRPKEFYLNLILI